MILIIMCDLKSFTDVASFSEAVASLGPSIHFLNSLWLLSTDKSLGHVHNTLHTRESGFDPSSPKPSLVTNHLQPPQRSLRLTRNSPPTRNLAQLQWPGSSRRRKHLNSAVYSNCSSSERPEQCRWTAPGSAHPCIYTPRGVKL